MIALLPETQAKTSACSTFGRIGACVYGFRMEPAPLIRRQKTCISFACMSGESENSFPSKGALKNREQVVLGPGLKEAAAAGHRPPAQSFSSIVLAPPLPPHLKRFSEFDPADQAFFLLASIMFMMCGALFALLATAIPTLNAMRRAALSLERLADAARQELPGTMAAIRLSGMEISDLTLELSDMSQEISESVRSSARAVHAAEVGIRRMGSLAASQTLSMLQEHASVPVEAVKPVVATAAETTRQAVTQAQKAVLGLAALPVLSKWIQKKNIEEQKKIEEDMGSGSNGGAHEEGSSEGMVDT